MNIRLNDNYLLDKIIFFDKNNNAKINKRAYKKLSKEELEYIKNRYIDSNSDNETIKRMLFGIEEKPKCPICGKPVKWLGKKNKLLLNTCSLECGFVLRTQHIKETCLEKYGVTNCYASEFFKEKIKQTCLEKYGVENPHQHFSVIEKTKNTCIQRYGLLNGGGTEQSILKGKQTKLERYGCETYVNPDKCKQTKLERYGNLNYNNTEKREITCLKKYGSTTWLNSLDRLNKIELYNAKIRKTKKKNHTYTSSKQESVVYNLLKKKFNNVICQHFDKDLYPFNCDFYIPSENIWIEYQGYLTHGEEPFDQNNTKHLEKVVILNNKDKEHKTPGKNLYSETINIWTKIDVNKRNTAKNNNLNYYEFWNIEQVKNWLKIYEKKDN